MSEEQKNEEQPVWKGASSQVLYLGRYVLCALIGALIIPISILLWPHLGNYTLAVACGWLVLTGFYAFSKWYALRSREYEVTTQRIRIRTGIFSKRTEDLELYRVTDDTLIEPFWQRLFKVGSIVLTTHDATTPQLTLEAVPKAGALRDEIRKNVELCRDRKHVRLAELE